ncbi:MAG: hypothetical protein ACFE9Z_12255 [Promethearchaeota archaeon]
MMVGYFILGGIIIVLCIGIIIWLILKISKSSKKNYIPQRAITFRCVDGHIVKSKGELIIDNLLLHLNIKHEYENTIKIRGKNVKYDWYLPDYNVYIEYWGYYGKKYMKRKQEKLDLYRKGRLKLISIEDEMLEDIHSNLKIELKKLTRYNEKKVSNKYCPNCGVELDKRFSKGYFKYKLKV